MIPRSSITGRPIQAARQYIDGRRLSLGKPFAPRVPCRSLWVVQSEGHVFAKFSPRECEDWKMPAEVHFGAGAEYRDHDGRTRLRGRVRKQEEPWVETARVHVGDVDTLEKATLVECMIRIIERSDYDPKGFSCIHATDALAATVRQELPIAPEGTDTTDGADDYMKKLAARGDSPPAGEVTFHLRSKSR